MTVDVYSTLGAVTVCEIVTMVATNSTVVCVCAFLVLLQMNKIHYNIVQYKNTIRIYNKYLYVPYCFLCDVYYLPQSFFLQTASIVLKFDIAVCAMQ